MNRCIIIALFISFFSCAPTTKRIKLKSAYEPRDAVVVYPLMKSKRGKRFVTGVRLENGILVEIKRSPKDPLKKGKKIKVKKIKGSRMWMLLEDP